MSIRVKYIGSIDGFSEVGITGQQQVWHRGSAGFVSDTNAALLIASGLFTSFEPVREGLGDKMRRLARRAEVSNPLINPPWTIPTAWAAATPYIQGDVRSNAGGWYVCVTSGTSAGSGGPTSTTTGSGIADNTAAWTYIGGPTITASDANAPVVTTSTAGTPTGLTNWFGPVAFPGCFKVTGGYASVFASAYWQIKSFDQKAGSTTQGGGEVSFETDAAKFAIGFTNNSPAVRVIIDGRYYSPSCITPASGATPNWIIFDFSSTSGRRNRSVTVEGAKGGLNFAGVRVTSDDMVWAPSGLDSVLAVFPGDSIWAGSNYGPWLSGGSVPQRLRKLLGWSDCRNFSTGGTGWINQGASSFYTFGQRVPEAAALNPDVWVLPSSTNDFGQTSAAITAAVLAGLRAIRDAGSSAPIIQFGCWPLNSASVAGCESAVQAAVDAFGDRRTFFIPMYGDPVLPWVTGAWNNSGNTSSANANMMIAGDATHPADIGTAYLAHRMDRAIRANVLPYLS